MDKLYTLEDYVSFLSSNLEQFSVGYWGGTYHAQADLPHGLDHSADEVEGSGETLEEAFMMLTREVFQALTERPVNNDDDEEGWG